MSPTTGRATAAAPCGPCRRILAELGFPVLGSLGFVESDLDELADLALADYFITMSPVPWSKDEVVAAFTSALQLGPAPTDRLVDLGGGSSLARLRRTTVEPHRPPARSARPRLRPPAAPLAGRRQRQGGTGRSP